MTNANRRAARKERAEQFRQELYDLARKSIGRNVACEIRGLPDDRLLALRQRARWNARTALQYLLVYGCRVVHRGVDV